MEFMETRWSDQRLFTVTRTSQRSSKWNVTNFSGQILYLFLFACTYKLLSLQLCNQFFKTLKCWVIGGSLVLFVKSKYSWIYVLCYVQHNSTEEFHQGFEENICALLLGRNIWIFASNYYFHCFKYKLESTFYFI